MCCDSDKPPSSRHYFIKTMESWVHATIRNDLMLISLMVIATHYTESTV